MSAVLCSLLVLCECLLPGRTSYKFDMALSALCSSRTEVVLPPFRLQRETQALEQSLFRPTATFIGRTRYILS